MNIKKYKNYLFLLPFYIFIFNFIELAPFDWIIDR